MRGPTSEPGPQKAYTRDFECGAELKIPERKVLPEPNKGRGVGGNNFLCSSWFIMMRT